MNASQRERLKNLDLVRKWIGENPIESLEIRHFIMRKICLVLGASEKTANEYIKEILGEI